LLVYSPHENGRMELVAAEYAVPLELSAAAPEGFQGAADEWFADQRFGLWTLHAWTWNDNPDGVFSPTNPWCHERAETLRHPLTPSHSHRGIS
jgi:hypothetical protein